MKTTDNKSGSSSQVISLPKGGGAIKGIGEKFQPNLFSGTGNFSIPIFTSPGRSGFGPQLTLQYSTGNGNGPFGLGWQLSIPRITRKTEKGLPKYDGGDVFVMSGAEDLVPCLRKINDPTTGEEKWIQEDPIPLGDYKITRYRPRTEGLFARIEKWVKKTDGDVYWRATTKENITSIYGKSASARLTHPDPEKTDPIYEWLLEETFDAKGNHILYEYIQEDLETGGISGIHEQNRTYTQTYIRRILYGNTPRGLAVCPIRTGTDHENPLSTKDRHYVFEVLFDYGDLAELPEIPFDPDKFPNKVRPSEWPVRKDPFSSYRAGYEIRTMRRCERVLMLHHFNEGKLEGAPLVKATEFEYNGSSHFYAGEFVLPLTIEKLCEVINNDNYNVTLQATINTIDWLNELLMITGFYDILNVKRPNSSFSKNITNLVDKTKDYRNKRFSDLNKDERDNIKRLNRLLLEETYPQETPKSQYKDDSQPYLSLLESVKVIGYRQDNKKYLWRDMPPITFKYSEFKPHEQHYQSIKANGNDLPPHPLNTPGMTLIDLFGDGLPDILHTTNTGYYYWRNLGNGNIDRRHPQHVIPAGVALSQSGVAVGDMGGDGLADIIVESPPLSGFYEATPDGGWRRFKKIETMPTISLSDPNVRLVDLTGDGLSDVLVTLDHHFLWFQCLGEKGYDKPQAVERIHNLDEFPDVYFNDPSGRVRLADMNGDGLNDIVLIHDGRIDYWPNLGYGQFGKRITMHNAPRIGYDFDPKRLFLVDLDGTGCTDIVYVNHDSVSFWFNHSGNGWSERQTIYGTPYVTDMTAIQFADFFGTGTACLVWSYDYNFQPGGNYKVLDFCGGVKPHLLTEMSNNMGATTCVRYASSTKFYLEDRENGEPWVTSLPFPVHVVEKVEVIDHISKTKLTTTYKYHHGYYDGREREFRGFGRVDQCDTEVFEAFAGTSLHKGVEFTNNKKAYHVPPVLTKTWFHTGVYFDENMPSADGSFYDKQDMMDAYRKEFYKEDNKAFVLGEHEVETGDTPHEAYRALRGSTIRTEVYALDGNNNPKSPGHPYLVTENRYQVKRLQPKDGNNHGVYLNILKEGIKYHYERNPADPRIAHQLTLVFDDYGSITDSVSVAYPRRSGFALKYEEQNEEQARIKAIYTNNRFINKDDDKTFYYIGINCETRVFEVHGLGWTWPAGSNSPRLLSDADFSGILGSPGTFEPYYPNPQKNLTSIKKRIVDWKRIYFRKNADPEIIDPPDSLAYRLELGKIESLGLPYESYQAAFTNDMLTTIYGNRIDSIGLASEGGYHKEDNYWWIPSGRQGFDGQKFYQPRQAQDPFGNKTTTETDNYALLVTQVKDALPGEKANTYKAKNDYRVLQPCEVTDPNGSCSQVAFDALGLVVGTAVMGHDEHGNAVGDSLDEFIADLPDDLKTWHIEDPLNLDPAHDANPHNILKKATTRLVYDLKRFANTGQPNVVYTLARETHVSAEEGTPSKIQHSFVYSDGFGREAQTKIQAEPGPVSEGGPDIDPRWVGTGTKVYNNKGKPVQQYEPFFSDTHGFGIEKHGVSPTIFYDPLERVICTMHPNHTYEKVVFDPWQQETWDVNDTVTQIDPSNDPDVGSFIKMLNKDDYLPVWYDLRTDDAKALGRWPGTDPRSIDIRKAKKDAAIKASGHVNTPTIAHLDTLGRPFLTISNNGKDTNGNDILFKTHVQLDIEGNDITITDPRQYELNKTRNASNRVHNFCHFFDIAGRKLRIDSIDAGLKLTFPDVAGNPVYAWDGEGHTVLMKYDELRRPTEIWVRDEGATNYYIVQKTIYGEEKTDPEDTKHRGKVWKVYDGAGLASSEMYDFKGNLRKQSRRLLQDGRSQVQWPLSNGAFDSSQSDVLLEPDTKSYTVETDYDALNRVIWNKTPDGTIQEPIYNEATLLDKLKVHHNGGSTEYVKNIEYNAKGQRTKIEYGNGVITTYSYDDETFRLTHLLTTRTTDNRQLQNLSYTYDPVGNITRILDEAHSTIFNHNDVIKPESMYKYDPLYRLVEATGREHESMTACHYRNGDNKQTELIQLALHPLQPASNGQALCNYWEQYTYDESGNITLIHHHNITRDIRWNRHQGYDDRSNRIKSSNAGCEDEETLNLLDHHDLNGNITKLPHLPDLKWDYRNQLIEVQLNNGTNPNKAYYQYDASGQRVRKIVVKNSKTEERIYIGGYENYTEWNGANPSLRRDTIHVMDDKNRIALIEDEKDLTTGDILSNGSRVRYQLSNHLDSSHLEVDESPDANIISYEEYYPYGGTSHLAGQSLAEVKLKRYRYSGKERDDETGLYYYGARYYAPWMGRWMSCDPLLDTMGSHNLFLFVRCNPVKLVDKDGLYERYGHLYGTMISALAGGHSDASAFELAKSAQTPDQVVELDATMVIMAFLGTRFGGDFVAKKLLDSRLARSLNVESYAKVMAQASQKSLFRHMGGIGAGLMRDKQITEMDIRAEVGAIQNVFAVQTQLHVLTGGSSIAKQKTIRQMLLATDETSLTKGLLLHSYHDSYAHQLLVPLINERIPILYPGPIGHAIHLIHGYGEFPDQIQNSTYTFKERALAEYDVLAKEGKTRMDRDEFSKYLDTLVEKIEANPDKQEMIFEQAVMELGGQPVGPRIRSNELDETKFAEESPLLTTSELQAINNLYNNK